MTFIRDELHTLQSVVVCAAGHRPNKLGGYGRKTLTNLYKLARVALSEINPDKVISGMALGWDTAVGLAAYSLGIPYISAIPFKGQENRWPEESRVRYNKLLQNAEEVVCVSEGGYSAFKMQVRNEWMVDHSNIVLALWNGDRGGTYNCVKYAEKVSKDVINVWEKYNKGGDC